MLVDVVAHQHVHGLLHLGELPQLGNDLAEGVHVGPVVGVHHFVVEPLGPAEPLIDPLAVAPVFLVHHPDDIGVLGGISVGDGTGIVLGAVIHKDDLHVVAAFQKRLDTVLHVSLRIITGDRECQQFHKIRSYCSRIPSHRVRARSAMASIL